MPLWLSVLLWFPLSTLGLAMSLLPRRAELALGPWLGRLLLRVDRKRRQIAYDNIRRCLPELGLRSWERLLKENYQHYGILVFELLHLFSPIPGHYRSYTLKISRVEGLDNWKKAHDKGHGVIFASAHMGNWEIMAAAGALAGALHGIAITMVTRHLKPEWLHKKIEVSRLSVNLRCAYQPRTLPALMRALRNGESVGFVIDQYAPPPMGVPVPFFGVKVNTLTAVAPLAQRTGAAVVPVSTYRDRKGLIHLYFEPELHSASTEILAAKVESWIRARPEQWLWVHRRFKNVTWPADRL